MTPTANLVRGCTHPVVDLVEVTHSIGDPKRRPLRAGNAATINSDNPQLGNPFILQMSDSPNSVLRWDGPAVSNSSKVYDEKPHVLTAVRRSQRFITWLAIYDVDQRAYFGLKAVTWSFDLLLEMDTTRQLKSRIKLSATRRVVRPSRRQTVYCAFRMTY